MKPIFSMVAAMVWLILCAGASAQTGGLKYSLKDLGVFGGVYSNALALNDSGTVVGYYTTKNQVNCFYYQSTSRFMPATTWKSSYPNGFCAAYGINNSGVIVGTITGSNGYYSAFTGIRSSKGLVSLTYLSSTWGLSTYGYSIDDFNSVTGAAVDSGGGDRAAFWNDGCTSGYYEMATDNSQGTLAQQLLAGCVGATDAAFVSTDIFTGETRAYNFDPWNNYFWEFLPLSNTNVNSRVNAWDQTDSFVGSSVAADGNSHATLWNWVINGYYPVDLGSPGQISWATGISSYYSYPAPGDWIIGQWQGGSVPFLKASTSTCEIQVSLQTLLDSSGTGWTLNQANAINANDQIAGAATINGVLHAVLLTPNGQPIC